MFLLSIAHFTSASDYVLACNLQVAQLNCLVLACNSRVARQICSDHMQPASDPINLSSNSRVTHV